MDIPIYYNDYSVEQLEEAIMRLDQMAQQNRADFMAIKLAEAEIARILTTRKVNEVIQAALQNTEENL